MGKIKNMKSDTLFHLREKDDWNYVWENAKLPDILKLDSLFGYCFDKVMDKHLKIDKPKEKKFLEIGCASGRFMIYINKKFNFKVYGIDYSPTGCELAKKNLELTQTKGTIICDDLFNIKKLKKESFNVVFSGGFIEHFEDTKTVLKKHLDLLKPGGLLIVEVPNMYGLHGLLFRIFNKQLYNKHKLITIKMVKNCLEDLRMQIKECSYIGSVIFESGGKPKFIQSFFLFLNKISFLSTKIFKITFQSIHISPYFIVIGKKIS